MPEPERPLPVPASLFSRWAYAFAATVIPIISFALSDVLKPEWQSGKTSDYVLLMLGPSVTPYFYPFLLYSVVCLLRLLWQPAAYARKFAVRFGIYTGFVLSLQYALLLALSVENSGSLILIGIFVVGLVRLIPSIYTVAAVRFGAGRVLLVIILSLGVILLSAFVFFPPADFLVVLPLVGLFIGGPFFCLAISGTIAYRLLKDYERLTMPLTQGLSGVGWLAAYLVAWRLAIQATLAAYAALPPQPPNCYIATAAAQGHHRLTGAQPVTLSDGRTLWVNAQLRYLKCGELALRALSPTTHRRVRRIYDRVGVGLAGRLQHPLLADAAYLTLKPVEWGVAWLLRRLVPNLEGLAARLYGRL
ncbi:MAG: hypothetical protein KDF65_15480 [Anaerolineae bacterium]|nr:hypothetical protein [Anaerolineae bacterium]